MLEDIKIDGIKNLKHHELLAVVQEIEDFLKSSTFSTSTQRDGRISNITTALLQISFSSSSHEFRIGAAKNFGIYCSPDHFAMLATEFDKMINKGFSLSDTQHRTSNDIDLPKKIEDILGTLLSHAQPKHTSDYTPMSDKVLKNLSIHPELPQKMAISTDHTVNALFKSAGRIAETAAQLSIIEASVALHYISDLRLKMERNPAQEEAEETTPRKTVQNSHRTIRETCARSFSSSISGHINRGESIKPQNEDYLIKLYRDYCLFFPQKTNEKEAAKNLFSRVKQAMGDCLFSEDFSEKISSMRKKQTAQILGF